MSTKLSTAFFFLMLGILWLILGSGLLTKGMFVDGLFYGAVAQNLANGFGGLWDLNATRHIFTPFYGHPPLGIWLLSSLMYLFDSAFWVERVFSLVNALCLLWGVAALLKLIQPKAGKGLLATVLFLWLCMPLNTWAFHQYLLENTLVVFAIWSCYWSIKGIKTGRYIAFLWSGLFLFAATFTKGPVGLFPLIVPVLYGLAFAKIVLPWTRLWLASFIVLIIVVLGCVLLYQFPSSRYYLNQYWELQLVGSFQQSVAAASSRWVVLKTLLLEGILAWLVCLLPRIAPTLAKADYPLTAVAKSWSRFFVGLALAASLPMLISPKQLRFYVVPALVFLAIGAALVAYPFLVAFAKRWNWARFSRGIIGLSVLCFLLGTGLMVYRYGDYDRDQTLLEDVAVLKNYIPAHTNVLIRVPEPAYSLEVYLMRLADIPSNSGILWKQTMKEELKDPTRFIITLKHVQGVPHYTEVTNIQLQAWRLFESNHYKNKGS